jgi:hypothetical protein
VGQVWETKKKNTFSKPGSTGQKRSFAGNWLIASRKQSLCVRKCIIALCGQNAVRRVRKIAMVTVSFVRSVWLPGCPSVRMKQLGSHWTDFDEI